MNRKLAASLAAITMAAASSPALAQWYAGASVGRTDVDLRAEQLGLTNALADKKDWSYGARLGYDFTNIFGAEIAYYHLGEYFVGGDLLGVPSQGERKLKAWSASLVGNLPFTESFSGYGKIGYARTEIGGGGEENSEAVYGVGLKWMVDKQWGLFAEWNRYQDLKLDTIMVGALVRF